jgi:hypothetical protein
MHSDNFLSDVNIPDCRCTIGVVTVIASQYMIRRNIAKEKLGDIPVVCVDNTRNATG